MPTIFMNTLIDNKCQRLEHLVENCLRDQQHIVAVYLFGSHVRRTPKQSSDVDLAFLVDEQVYRSDPFQASSAVYVASAHISLVTDHEVDVTILNAASVEMAYQIITSVHPETRFMTCGSGLQPRCSANRGEDAAPTSGVSGWKLTTRHLASCTKCKSVGESKPNHQ